VANEQNKSKDDVPLTLEVGDEGGSYADAVVQEATRDGDLATVDPNATQPTARGGESDRPVSPPPDEPEDGVHFPRRTNE